MADKGLYSGLITSCWKHDGGSVYISREFQRALNQSSDEISKKASELVGQELNCAPCMLTDNFNRCKRKDIMLDLKGVAGNPFRTGEGFNFIKAKDTSEYDELTRNLGNAQRP
eukprot:UN05956